MLSDTQSKREKDRNLQSALYNSTITETCTALEAGGDPNATDETGRPLLLGAIMDCPSKPDMYERVKLLLKYGADVKGTCILKNTLQGPLHLACYGSNPEICQILIDHGAIVNTQDANGETPLHIAIQRGKPNHIKLLLKHGANPSIKDKHEICSITRGFVNALRGGDQPNWKTILEIVKNIRVDNSNAADEILSQANRIPRPPGTLNTIKNWIDNQQNLTPLPTIKSNTQTTEIKKVEEEPKDTPKTKEQPETPKKEPEPEIPKTNWKELAINLSEIELSQKIKEDKPTELELDEALTAILEKGISHKIQTLALAGTKINKNHIRQAILKKHNSCLLALLEMGASAQDWKPAELNELTENQHACLILLNYGATADESTLETAIQNDSLELAMKLVSAGMQGDRILGVENKSRLNRIKQAQQKPETKQSQTPLIEEDPAKTRQFSTPINRILWKAALEGDINKLKEAVQNGANPNQYNGQGTSLINAAIAAQPETCEKTIDALLEAGATINIESMGENQETTPLHMAASRSAISLIKKFIRLGADPNSTNKNGDTPLHWIDYNQDVTIATMLENNGANFLLRNTQGRYAIEQLFEKAQDQDQILETIKAANKDEAELVANQIMLSNASELAKDRAQQWLKKENDRSWSGAATAISKLAKLQFKKRG